MTLYAGKAERRIIMGYSFDDFIYDAKKAIDKMGEKTGAAVEYSKTQVEKAQLKGKLREKYCDLGKLCYEMHERDIDYTGSMKKLLEQIREIETQIEEADIMLGVPKICPLCGTKNAADNTYCTKCGEKLK